MSKCLKLQREPSDKVDKQDFWWLSCPNDGQEQPATNIDAHHAPITLASTSVEFSVETPTTLARRHAIRKAGRRQHNKYRLSSRHVKTRRSFDWKLANSAFNPLHEQFSFTLVGCVDDEGLNVLGDLPHCCPSDSILARDLSRERIFINPP
jgi:hypothetical protein